MKTLPRAPHPAARSAAGWRLARILALVGLAAMGVLLAVAPDRAVRLLWYGIVPVLPVLFLLHPSLWRNVCPLATLGMGPETSDGPTVPPGSGAAACLLLLLLIPLRPLGLEGHALASAGLLGAAVLGALAGRSRPQKAGFCNRWCPVLPVERLYGQRPLLPLANARCPTCTLCTPRGCLDLSPRAASAQLLGSGRRGWRWLLTPLGAFAAAFPGVVLAFFLLPPDPGVMEAYGRVFLGAATSWSAAACVLRLVLVPWGVALPSLAALAAGPYLWFALPSAVQAWGMQAPQPAAGWAGVALVTVWWMRAVARPHAVPPRIQTFPAPGAPGGSAGRQKRSSRAWKWWVPTSLRGENRPRS